MKTPIVDFVRAYGESGALRAHMPGHKGAPLLGMETLDITEIHGADSLYEASGIIRESERGAGALFGCDTFYSTEGSSQCIRAMLYLALLHAKAHGKAARVLAGRNAHKTFLTAAALLDLDVAWLFPDAAESYLACTVKPAALDALLSTCAKAPAAVYLTSPDYLGNVADVRAIADVCRRHGVLLLVDNAHGAYLKFLPESAHPIDLGADLCCDSAHKTLPVLTGGAYLHISPRADAFFREHAKGALALFGSTSPSYLILQSLDAANRYLDDGYPEKLGAFAGAVDALKDALASHGYTLTGDEMLKVTVRTKPFGYRGQEMAQELAARGVTCEFADPDFVVLMLTPELGSDGLLRIADAMCAIPNKEPIAEEPPAVPTPERVMTVREAMFSPCETVAVSDACGRILAAPSVGCPPAVPLAVSGERIDEAVIAAFQYYGIAEVTVVREK